MAKTASMANFNGHPDFKKTASLLVGRTITDVLTDEEMEARGFSKRGPVLLLDDGTELIPLMDDEGNNPGALEITRAERLLGLLPVCD